MSVEPVHGFVPVGHERNGFTSLSGCPPCSDDLGFHFQGCAAVESTLPLIFGEGVWVAFAELKAGFAFPFMVEPVYLFEFCRSVRVDEVSEHSASSHGGELAWVSDHDDPPLLPVCELGEGGEFGCGCSSCFVEDDRRLRWQ